MEVSRRRVDAHLLRRPDRPQWIDEVDRVRADDRRVLSIIVGVDVEADADVVRRDDSVVRQAVRQWRQRLVLVLVCLDLVQVVGESQAPKAVVVAAVAGGSTGIKRCSVRTSHFLGK